MKYSMSKEMWKSLYKTFSRHKNIPKAILNYVNETFGIKNGVTEIIIEG